ILAHVDLIIAALDDPNKNSDPMLDALMRTNFIHHIDAPSLSLIMPTINKALSSRETETKRKAAKIVGSICQLTERKDLQPYLQGLMGQLQDVLIDPIPSTRAIAAKVIFLFFFYP